MDSVSIFIKHEHLLNDCRFIFAADDGMIPGLSINKNFSKRGVIRSLFKTSKVWVLDSITLNEMHNSNGNASFPIDHSVSLDSQAFRYIKPYLQGKTSKVPADFVEVFEFLARSDVNCDPMPYLFENLFKPNSIPDYSEIFSYYKSYEVLKTLDSTFLQTTGQIQSVISDEQLNIQTQKSLAKMLYAHDDGSKERLQLQIDTYYTLVLQMAMIHFYYPKLVAAQKMLKFIEFMDQKLATIGVRESIIAFCFFEKGTDLAFFGTIQKNSPDILQEIRNKAWDFWHIRYVESLAKNLFKEARYFFPSLLTFDKRFIEIIDLCPLKAHVHIEGINEYMCFYDDEALNALNATIEASKAEHYFSSEAIQSRSSRKDNARKNLPNIIDKLELEIIKHCAQHKARP